MRPRPFDRDSYPSEIWKARLRWFVRAGGMVHDLLESSLVVLLGLLVGAIAGVLVLPNAVGAIGGTVAGAGAGVVLARRVFFSEARSGASREFEPTPGAPRWPGVTEQFERILFRARALMALLAGAFLAICYLRLADRFHWPVPAAVPRLVLLAGLLSLDLVALLLLVLTLRCPKCRALLWRAAEIFECPHCGTTLRD